MFSMSCILPEKTCIINFIATINQAIPDGSVVLIASQYRASN